MMIVNEPEKIYDLEERTFQFAKNVRLLIKKSPFNNANCEDGKQVVKKENIFNNNQ
ncbi:MAG: hypothetical protein PHE56_15750 [Bacteroidales bacterium]|nr:hypothetical protein [Bacteroidales bacterium]